jgi:hypothetical protein
VRVTSAPPVVMTRGRTLPVMPAATIGTYGR